MAHAEALFDQGVEAYQQGHFQSAHEAFAACLDEYQILVDEGHSELRPELAGTRMNLAICLSDLGELSVAKTTYETTLTDYERLIDQDGRVELRPELAGTRMNLAICLEEMADFPAANTQYQAAVNLLQILQQLGQLFPDAIKMIRNIADWYRHPQRPPQPAVRYPLHYLPAMQVLRLIQERAAAQQQKGCIIANPTQNLTSAEPEGETVYQLRGQIDEFLSGSKADLSAVRQVLNQS